MSAWIGGGGNKGNGTVAYSLIFCEFQNYIRYENIPGSGFLSDEIPCFIFSSNACVSLLLDTELTIIGLSGGFGRLFKSIELDSKESSRYSF